MLRTYLKIAFRTLARNRVSSAINLAGLTLGITACLVIYFITRYELSYDTFHPDEKQIFRVVGTAKFGTTGEWHPVGFVPVAAPAAIRREVPGLETLAAFHNFESDVQIPRGTDKPVRFPRRDFSHERAEMIVVEPQYFDIFQYQWLAGNPKTALNEPFQLVLSERKARKYFGPTVPLDQIVGKHVVYLDSIQASVTGIVKDWDGPSDLAFTDFLSFATIDASLLKGSINLREWDDLWSASQAFVKLPAGTTPAQLTPRFQQFARNHKNRDFKQLQFIPALQPLSDLHFDAKYTDNYSRKAHLPTLYGLMGVAGFILIIAAINFINLATAQATQRAREIGVHKILGSTRGRLIGQFLSETLVLTLAALLIALVLVRPILNAYSTLIPQGLTIPLFTGQTLSFLLGVLGVTALLAGLYPAWVLSGYAPARVLKGLSAFQGGEKGILRKTLIVFQFTVSLVFIIGTLLVGRQLQFMRNKDLGFNTAATLEIRPGRGDDKNRILVEKVRQLPGVERVALEWFPPMGESFMVTKLKYRGTKEVEMDVSAKVGDENFIPLYQLRLLAGRNYLKSDSLRELVINATYAKALGFKKPADALNELIEFQGKSVPVVGVVADFHEQSFHEKMGPVFIGFLPRQARNLGIKLATHGQGITDVQQAVARLESAWKEVYPDQKFEYSFLDDAIARLYAKEQKTAQLVNTATGVAILISCMGLFGLATFTAQRRTKEIGIRKVLGASVASLVALLSREFVVLFAVALLIASPLAWYLMNEWLKDFAYKVAIDGWVFALAGLLALSIALLTVASQSIRAALMNPTKSLKTE